MRQYRCRPGAPVGTLHHADVYRTGSVAEVADLALAELVEEDAVAVVEWGDVAAPALGESALEVTLTVPDADVTPNRRILTLRGRGTWAPRVGEVADVLGSEESAGGRRQVVR